MQESPNEKAKIMSKAFYFWTGLLIGLISATMIFFLIYVIHSNPIHGNEECLLFKIGNWFDLFVSLAGIAGAIIFTWWVSAQGYMKEQYCVAVLAFIGFLMYGLVTYGLKSQTCDSPKGPGFKYQYSTGTQKHIDENKSSSQN